MICILSRVGRGCPILKNQLDHGIGEKDIFHRRAQTEPYKTIFKKKVFWYLPVLFIGMALLLGGLLLLRKYKDAEQ